MLVPQALREGSEKSSRMEALQRSQEDLTSGFERSERPQSEGIPGTGEIRAVRSSVSGTSADRPASVQVLDTFGSSSEKSYCQERSLEALNFAAQELEKISPAVRHSASILRRQEGFITNEPGLHRGSQRDLLYRYRLCPPGNQRPTGIDQDPPGLLRRQDAVFH